jgi:hypothetical protein
MYSLLLANEQQHAPTNSGLGRELPESSCLTWSGAVLIAVHVVRVVGGAHAAYPSCAESAQTVCEGQLRVIMVTYVSFTHCESAAKFQAARACHEAYAWTCVEQLRPTWVYRMGLCAFKSPECGCCSASRALKKGL